MASTCHLRDKYRHLFGYMADDQQRLKSLRARWDALLDEKSTRRNASPDVLQSIDRDLAIVDKELSRLEGHAAGASSSQGPMANPAAEYIAIAGADGIVQGRILKTSLDDHPNLKSYIEKLPHPAVTTSGEPLIFFPQPGYIVHYVWSFVMERVIHTMDYDQAWDVLKFAERVKEAPLIRASKEAVEVAEGYLPKARTHRAIRERRGASLRRVAQATREPPTATSSLQQPLLSGSMNWTS
ncbi:hypothetical protein WJX72_007702 [[Myrmecia] bisecta]|uniref:Uncharacterized protein n=1 Tax=[Myrmecia] bisecta TaxID=41462 RepID=A0AAW1QFQ2_9CHLO